MLQKQLRERRKALGLTQREVAERVNMPRQQYQRLEAGGNPRLETLELVAASLNAELMLVPLEKRAEALNLTRTQSDHSVPLDEDPWKGMLGDDEGGK
ncbi:helix-turn-helix transcriptional regulator [Vreelandella utahensis]|uniref:helix-turn-helix transcriptional regulator n=1 Tax=Vreelandella halophila TaxID=86177 RepID=UPI0009878B9E|nr:helix-turn-helix transcriptional regulator [Halomonas utahensis]